MSYENVKDSISEETIDKIISLQQRCVVCGGTFNLHRHHRIFRSQGQKYLEEFLKGAIAIHEQSYGRKLEPWGLHDMQNLVTLCQDCHEAPNKGVHGGNESLRRQLVWSFTCPITGFNIPFKKKDDPFRLTI